MKILHVCLSCFYIDNYSYQENLLPKYHKLLGHDVVIIASCLSFTSEGSFCLVEGNTSYLNEYGIPVHRIAYKKPLREINRKLRRYDTWYGIVENFRPDVIFIHGCQFMDVKYIVNYAKTNRVRVYVDNHSDFLNSAMSWVTKNIIHRILWRRCAKKLLPHTDKFYGVLPARIDFLKKMYQIPPDKIDLLIMGADDEEVRRVRSDNSASSIREKHNIKDNDFLIITGGKIDYNKPQTLLLMEAVKDLDRSNVQLIVFGSVSPEYKERFESLLNSKVKYVGWLNTKATYEYLNASDLVVLPGLHSVLWEQAVGLGKPCVFRYIEGFTHVDLGGNCRFIREDSKKEIESILLDIIENKETYESMKEISLSKGISTFSYKQIAIKSIS